MTGLIFHADEWKKGLGVGAGGAELWRPYAAPISAAQMEQRGHFIIISGTSHGSNKMETAHSVPCFYFILSINAIFLMLLLLLQRLQPFSTAPFSLLGSSFLGTLT